MSNSVMIPKRVLLSLMTGTAGVGVISNSMAMEALSSSEEKQNGFEGGNGLDGLKWEGWSITQYS